MKTVHWQVPFQSVGGTKYRIDIYAEGAASTPEVLTGADGVFTTEENQSDDFFEPVRSQTGTLRLVDPDGTLLERLVPANNTDRPLRLINEQTGAVEWQGFLKSEAYTQEYTGRPKVFDIPVNGMLEAMDSISVTSEAIGQSSIIRYLIVNLITMLNNEAGFQVFQNVVHPASSFKFFENVVNTLVFFDPKEQTNEYSITYENVGVSCKKVLEYICQFMGWTARCSGTTLYMTDITDARGSYVTPFSYLGTPANVAPLPYGAPTSPSFMMQNLSWGGDNHSKSIRQGAKSVSVVASIRDFSVGFSVPDAPYGTCDERKRDTSTFPFPKRISMYSLAYPDRTFNNLCEFKYYQLQINSASVITGIAQTDSYRGVYHSSVIYTPQTTQYGAWSPNVGAFMCRMGEKEDDKMPSTQSGLYLCSIANGMHGFTPTASNYVFRMKNSMPFQTKKGYLLLNAIGTMLTDSNDEEFWMPSRASHIVSLRFGDMYWNGSAWGNSFATFSFFMSDGKIFGNYSDQIHAHEQDGIFIPITENMNGEIELKLYHPISGFYIYAEGSQASAKDAFFSELSVNYVSEEDERFSDRSSNSYFRKVPCNSGDEVTVGVELASFLSNKNSPSLILNTNFEPVGLVEYLDSAGNIVLKRPEVVLLDKLEAYYRNSRRILDLTIEKSASIQLPITKLTGYDGRIYISLSERKDWQYDKSTIKCFEVPD